MALTKFERGTTWKATVTFTSGSTNIDCSGNMAYLTVYRPDGTVLLGPESGCHEATGMYNYYVSTQSTDDLGIYVTEWKGLFDYQHPFHWSPKYDRNPIQLVYVKR